MKLPPFALSRLSRADIPLVLVGILLVHAALYLPFLCDDALISLRYAERLATGHGLTWTDGPRVEGYSNLLWVLVLAVVGLFRIDLVFAARLLSLLCMSIPLFVLAREYSRQATVWRESPPLVLAGAFYVLAAPVAIWSIGGLEQALMVALLALAAPGVGRLLSELQLRPGDVTRTLVPLGLLCITRPDGPLFVIPVVGLLGLVALFRTGFRGLWQRIPMILVVLLVPMAFYLLQLGFRLAYYGEWVPNTALVKLAPSLGRAALGWIYIRDGLVYLSPWLAVAGISALWSLCLEPEKRFRTLMLLGWMIPWLLYIAVIGGDIFPGHRHLVPLMVPLLFLSADGLVSIWAHLGSRWRVVLGASGLVVVSVYAVLQWQDPYSRNAREERWEFEGQVLGTVLRKAFGEEQPLVAVTSAGCLPFWSRLPSLDMLGLNDYYLPRHPPADFGQGMIGHELGNGAYVMAQNPDIVIFNTGIPGPAFRSGEEMYAMPEFRQRYAQILVYGNEPKRFAFAGYIWVNRESSKIGIRYAKDRIEIPAMFMNYNARMWAQLDKNNKLARFVSDAMPAMMDLGETDYTSWQCVPQTEDNRPVRCQIFRDNGKSILHIIPKPDVPGPEVPVEHVTLLAPNASG